MTEQHDKQLEREAVDWLYCVVGTLIIAALIFAAVWGHSVVSAGFAP